MPVSRAPGVPAGQAAKPGASGGRLVAEVFSHGEWASYYIEAPAF
ncbi:hypothetical protein AB0478_27535 [Streptomyces sp. NPDC051917]